MDTINTSELAAAVDDAQMHKSVLTSNGQQCLQMLLRVWFDFERTLGTIPLIQRLEQDRLSQQDYQRLLLSMRQQVIEGSRWITRCASSFDRTFSDVRSEVIGHAYDEHRDYEMLERDYVAAGGTLHEIQQGTRNCGSEALHGFMMYRSSQPNPVDMIGAMWIIEGLGNKMASQWANHVDVLMGASVQASSFMRYHGENDEAHMNELYQMIDRVCSNPAHLPLIERTARVVAKLYLMQIKEIDHG